ncbi:MAG: GxxExxY protein [Candidatus Omnitrophota bacterium]
MAENKYEFNDGTPEIISAALEVHKAIGPGFLEVVYQRALFYEMKLRNIEFTREAEIDIIYKGKKVGKKRVDFYVGDCLIEIKAKAALEDIDFMEILSYLRASNKKIAQLLNFGGKKLEIKRIVN